MTDVFTYILALAGAWSIALPASHRRSAFAAQG